jgi:hypothetical protein
MSAKGSQKGRLTPSKRTLRSGRHPFFAECTQFLAPAAHSAALSAGLSPPALRRQPVAAPPTDPHACRQPDQEARAVDRNSYLAGNPVLPARDPPPGRRSGSLPSRSALLPASPAPDTFCAVKLYSHCSLADAAAFPSHCHLHLPDSLVLVA